MKKAKFVQDAKLDPSRYYRNPSDAVRDRRLNNQDRLDILAAWERIEREREQNSDLEGGSEGLELLRRVREELERNLEASRAAPSGVQVQQR